MEGVREWKRGESSLSLPPLPSLRKGGYDESTSLKSNFALFGPKKGREGKGMEGEGRE